MGKLVCTGAALSFSFGAKPSTFSAFGQKVRAVDAGSARAIIGQVAALDDASHCAGTWARRITVSSPGQERAPAG